MAAPDPAQKPAARTDEQLRLDFWREKYASDHTPWDLGGVSDPVQQLADTRFPPGGAVLIPGCGRGHEAIHLGQRGCRVTAVDFAEAPISHLRAEAQTCKIELELVLDDVFAWARQTDKRFDVLLEQTFLCAIEPALHAEYERMARRLLKPGGLLAGVFMEVEGDGGPPYNCPPDLVKTLFGAEHWQLDWLETVPLNPLRPGPEYVAGFSTRPAAG